MDTILIQIYLLVCQTYDTHSETCFQRLSNNNQPDFTDQELVTIYLFGHLNGHQEKLAIHGFIKNYWAEWFPALPAYQTFCYRLNLLEQTFQTIGGVWFDLLKQDFPQENDHLIDSMPIMLAANGHAYTAKVARDQADVGYCSAKKTYFHGLRLHSIAARRTATLPTPRNIWLREASTNDLQSVRDQEIYLPNTTLIGDKAFPDPDLEKWLANQNTRLLTPIKKPKGKELTKKQKAYNRLISRLRQPIESLFNWIDEKTGIQTASKVRSTDGLMIHCFGKLTFAMLLLVFNY
jgi:hypothetical protein